jgi:hypothetical protein
MGDIKQKDRIKITGNIRVDVYRNGYADLARPYFERLAMLKSFLQDFGGYGAHENWTREQIGKTETVIEQIKREFFLRTAVECPNTVMDSPNYGLDLLIQWLSGIGTFASTIMPLSYIEIGTGSTTPAITDTALTTPTNRAAVGFQQDYATTDAIVQAIFSDSQLTNGTYYEMGTFCGGTTTIGSGQLFNHALFGSAYTKAAGTDTTIETDINFST